MVINVVSAVLQTWENKTKSYSHVRQLFPYSIKVDVCIEAAHSTV